MDDAARIQWFVDRPDGAAQVLVRIQSQPFPPRIHVLTREHGWRHDRQLRHHRKQWDSAVGREIDEAEARRIAASWGCELLSAWDDSVPLLEESGPA